MIRVLYVIDSMSRMGTQLHIASMMREHDRLRFRPSLLCLQEKGAVGKELETDGYHVASLGLEKIYGIEALAKWMGLVAFLRKERIEVVHCYLFAAQIFGIPAARLAGVPLAVAGRRAVGVYWTAPHYAAARRVSNRLAHLEIANSQAVRDFVVGREGVPPEKVRIVRNGVDTDRFHPPASIESDRPLTVGYAGNITRVKRVDLLLEAASRLLLRYPDLRVVVVGAGPDRARRSYEGRTDEEVRRLAEERGIAGKVFFRGESADVAEEMRRMDVFVLPSAAEGMSNAVLEAMATGLPVVATDSGGNREVIVHGRTGFLFPAGDVERLASYVRELLDEPARREEMGKRGRERVLERFTKKRMVAEMERVYMEELERRRR